MAGSVEFELIRDATRAEVVVIETQISLTSADDKHVRIEGRLGPEQDGDSTDDVERYAFGFIYALGMLSFADARPCGSSAMLFEKKDEWAAEDMLRYLRFIRGELHFHADYERGRWIKTTIIVRADGRFTLETVNRGEAATRWVAKVQGKRPIRGIWNARAEA